MLIKDQIAKAERYLDINCRPLEKARFDFHFNNGDPTNIIKELLKFQNTDGGFGNGLEPDFLTPNSSPLATSLAFQFLEEISNPSEEVIKNAVRYLESSFIKDRMGWFAMSWEVNNYPHAIWWNWNEETKQTAIDASFGNPTAEIIGYLSKYKKYLKTLDIDSLIDYAINYWRNKQEFTSEHEIYCFIKMHKYLPPEKAKLLEDNLIKATERLVTFDPIKWQEYTPQPIHFADNPNAFLFNTVKGGIETNLDYLINSINEHGVWSPNWTWGQYESEWPKSKINWEGIIAIQNLRILQAYEKIGT